ncbi:MAG: MipA/OmpV family protein [Gammaproteobacteria bacterium]
MMKKLSVFIAMILFWQNDALAQIDEAGKEPLWEIGVAGGVLSTPHYMGSDQRYILPIAAPYFIYRGKFIRANRRGIKGLLINRKNFSLDLGLGFGLPVNNNNKAREDMPDLSLTGQIGPQLNWKFSRSGNLPQVSLHLPIRYVADVQAKKLGWVTEPSLLVKQNLPVLQNKISLHLRMGGLLAGKSFNKYYYTVADQYARQDRPAYVAKSGFHSYFMKLSSTYAWSKYLSMGAFIQLRDLSQGVVDDSPLVTQALDVSLGIGFVWSVRQSVALEGQSLRD